MKLKPKRLNTSFQSGVQAKIISQLNKSPRISALLQRRRSGFTLVELAVNIAIIGIITVIVTMLTTTSITSFDDQHKKLDALNLGELIINTISDQVSKSANVKLCNYFVESTEIDVDTNSIKYLDQTGNGDGDKYITDKDGHHYPICLDDMQAYNTIVLIPDKAEYNNDNRNKLTGANRRGKLYKLKLTADAQLDTETKSFIVNKNNNPVTYTPLFDESYYKGYLVDVSFEYVAQTNTQPDTPNTDGTGGNAGGTNTETGGADNPQTIAETNTPNLNAIRINVDVYNGNNVVYSTSSVVTFLQYYFKMQEPTKVQGTADLKPKKDMILFR